FERDLVAMSDPGIPHLPRDQVERILPGRSEETRDREALARSYLGIESGLGDVVHAVLLLSCSANFPCSCAAFAQPSGQRMMADAPDGKPGPSTDPGGSTLLG